MRIKYKAKAKMVDNSGALKPLHPMEAKRPLMITVLPAQDIKYDRSVSLEGKIKTFFFVK